MNLMLHIQVRVEAWTYFLKGWISFWQALMLMLPNSMRPLSLKGGDEFLIITLNQYRVDLIKDNATVVDVGASRGVFTELVAQKHPNATIYAFEPTLRSFNSLKENTKNYPNVKCFNCALGDTNGTVKFMDIGIDENGVDHCEANYISEVGIPCDIKTIDSFNIPINFLKIDAEGHEAKILLGATETIRKYKPIIVMSAYHRFHDPIDLPRVLNSICPYTCELVKRGDLDLICRPIIKIERAEIK